MGLLGDEALESLTIEGSFTGTDPVFERFSESAATSVEAVSGATLTVRDSFTGDVASAMASARRAFAGMADAATARISGSFTKTLSAEEMMEGFGGGRDEGVSVEISSSFTGGASLKGMLAGAFGKGGGTLVVTGSSAGVAPASMEGFLKGSAGLARADLSGIWAASANMKEAYLGCAGLTSVQMGGDGSASGALTLPATWSGLAAADKTRMLAGCTGLTRASFTGSVSGGVADEMMSGCANVGSVAFAGTPASGVVSMKRMFSGCAKMSSLDLTGVSTAGMAGDFSTTGNLSAMGSMLEGCSLLVTATGTAAASPATITVGAQFGKLLNGFFGARETGSSTPQYVMASSVSVQCGASNGPQRATDLMQRPNWTVGSTTYAFSGKVYIAHKTLIDEVWVARGYVGSIKYTESDVNKLIGDFGNQFGRTTAYGFIGSNGANGIGGDAVAWRIMTSDAGVGTLCIAPNSKAGYSASNPATMQSFGEGANAAPWTGRGMAGGDGDGYSKSFSRVKVMSGVTSGQSMNSMFHTCTNLADADFTSLTVNASTTSFYKMFQQCTSLRGVYNNQAETADSTSTIAEGLRLSTKFNPTAGGALFQMMFEGCSGMQTVNLTGVTNGSFNGGSASFYAMFLNCTGLRTVTLNNIGNGTSARGDRMFQGAFASNDLASVNTVMNITNCFNGQSADCGYFANTSPYLKSVVIVDAFKGSGVHVEGGFQGCPRIKSLSLTRVGTGAEARLDSMFHGAQGLTTLTATTVGTASKANLNNMFYQCGADSNYVAANSTGSYVLDNVGSGGANLYNVLCNTLRASNFTSSKIEWKNSTTSADAITYYQAVASSGADILDMRGMPRNGYDATSGAVGNLDGHALFQGCTKIKYICNGLPTSSVNNADALYKGSGYTTGYIALPETDVFGLGNDGLIGCSTMFANMPLLEKVYLTAWKSRCLYNFVSGCPKLKYFKMTGSGIDMSNGGFISNMFNGCSTLERVEFMQGVRFTWVSNTFANCPNLSYLDFTGVNTDPLGYWSNTQGMLGMFSGSTKIVKMGGTGAETTTTPATIKLGAGVNQIWNGFFWNQPAANSDQVTTTWGTSAPNYMMYANTNIEVNVGPTATGRIIRSLDLVINGTRYKSEVTSKYKTRTSASGSYALPSGASYTLAQANFAYTGSTTQLNIWKTQGYMGGINTGNNLGYNASSTTPTSAVTYTLSADGKNLVIKANSTNAQMMRFGSSAANGQMTPPWYQSRTLETVRFEGFVSGGTTYPVKAVQLHYMFDGNSALKNVNFANLDTSAVTSMAGMFRGCSSLASVDLSALKTQNVTDMRQLFYSCTSLTTCDLSRNNLAKVENMSALFYGCSSLTGKFTFDDRGDKIKFPARTNTRTRTLSKVVTFEQMLQGTKLTEVEMICVGSTDSYVTMGRFITYNQALTKLQLEEIAPKGFRGYHFADSCFNLRTASLVKCGITLNSDGSIPKVNTVEELSYGFWDCTALETLLINNSFNGSSEAAVNQYDDNQFNVMLGGTTSPKTATITDSFNGSDRLYYRVFAGFNRDVTGQSLTITNCFNGTPGTPSYATPSTNQTRAAQTLLFAGCGYLRNLTMTNCLNGAGRELKGVFDNCPRLSNLTLTNVGMGKSNSLYQMFNNVGGGISGQAVWSFTDVGSNSSNLRSMFTNCFNSTSISSNSSLTSSRNTADLWLRWQRQSD